jgi:flagellar protein FlgJ
MSAQATAGNSLSFQGLNQLKAAAQADPSSPQAIKAVAQQFEALLMQQMLAAMDATSLGPDMLGDTAGPMFRSLFNQQIATTVSQGQGIGLANFIARELSARYGKPATAETHAASVAPSGMGHPAPLPATAPVTAAVAPTLPVSAARAPAVRPSTNTPVSSGTGSATPPPADPGRAADFIAGILPSVQAAAQRLGVTPVAILAQAALETGWGRHVPGNNLFGVKTGDNWTGGTVQALTREVRDGVASAGTAAFRAYQSVTDSVQNYAALLSRPRYRNARGVGNDIPAFAAALQHSGYATDPDYAAKLLAVARSPQMRQALGQLGVDSSLAVP